jgi:hypothetical protein
MIKKAIRWCYEGKTDCIAMVIGRLKYLYIYIKFPLAEELYKIEKKL